MGDDDDAEARRKRAADLREQIAGDTAGEPHEPGQGQEPVLPPSPREFVHRRMRELSQGKKGPDDPPGS